MLEEEICTYGVNPCKAFAAPAAAANGDGCNLAAKAAAAAADAGKVALARPLGIATPRSAAAAFYFFLFFLVVINYTIERVFVRVEKKGKKIMRLVEIINKKNT